MVDFELWREIVVELEAEVVVSRHYIFPIWTELCLEVILQFQSIQVG